MSQCALILRWRAAFYIAGMDSCVVNFLNLLDEFLSWKVKASQKEVEAGFWSWHIMLIDGVGRLFVRCTSTRSG